MNNWKKYAEIRKDLNYYKKIREKILDFSPNTSILDVGPGGINLVLTGDFVCRCVVNREPMTGVKYPNTHVIISDWLEAKLPLTKFNLVLCCQVLEHLSDEEIKPFVDKLLEVSKGGNLIISVPYKWSEDECKYHKQDPVDLEKLISWIGLNPVSSDIIKDGRVSRLISTFRN